METPSSPESNDQNLSENVVYICPYSSIGCVPDCPGSMSLHSFQQHMSDFRVLQNVILKMSDKMLSLQSIKNEEIDVLKSDLVELRQQCEKFRNLSFSNSEDVISGNRLSASAKRMIYITSLGCFSSSSLCMEVLELINNSRDCFLMAEQALIFVCEYMEDRYDMCQGELGENGACDLIVSILKKYNSLRNYEILSHVVKILSYLCTIRNPMNSTVILNKNSNKSTFGRLGICDWITRVIRDLVLSDQNNVLSWDSATANYIISLIEAIWSLSNYHLANKEKFQAAGAANVLISLLRHLVYGESAPNLDIISILSLTLRTLSHEELLKKEIQSLLCQPEDLIDRVAALNAVDGGYLREAIQNEISMHSDLSSANSSPAHPVPQSSSLS